MVAVTARKALQISGPSSHVCVVPPQSLPRHLDLDHCKIWIPITLLSHTFSHTLKEALKLPQQHKAFNSFWHRKNHQLKWGNVKLRSRTGCRNLCWDLPGTLVPSFPLPWSSSCFVMQKELLPLATPLCCPDPKRPLQAQKCSGTGTFQGSLLKRWAPPSPHTLEMQAGLGTWC